MKHIVILFLLLLCDLVALASIQQENNPITYNFTTAEKEYIKSHTVTLGMINDYYPFSFKEGDKIVGFSYDMIQLIIQKSGLNITIEMDNWSSTLTKFKNKEIDLIDVISYSEKRATFTNFSQPYFEIPNVIFTRKGEFNEYNDFESLRGKKVGITKDIYYYNAIKSLNLFELVEFKNSKDKMKALAYGQIDAIFNNLISDQKYIKRGAYSNIKVLEEIDSSIVKKEDLRIGIQKENLLLLSIIEKSMLAITRGEKESVYKRWFGVNGEDSHKKDTLFLDSSQKEYLLHKKQITMCVDPEWMPYSFYRDHYVKRV